MMRTSLKSIFVLGIVSILIACEGFADTSRKTVRSGEIWIDHNEEPISAHGGGILKFGDTYYWYGEIKKGDTYLPRCNASWGGTRVDVTGVSCYSSKNLIDWKNEGNVLPSVTHSVAHDLHVSKVVERPKVIYNEKTKKFVMWFHLDSQNYEAARSGVAISEKPVGPFQYLHSLRPNAGVWPSHITEESKEDAKNVYVRDHFIGQMARDMTLFVDDDGSAYQIYASEENATLHISKLSDDYLWPAGEFIRAFEGRFMEAPAIFKSDNKYYIFASGCTAWEPNAARSAVADDIMGPWHELGNPCVGNEHQVTFRSQSTFVLPLEGKGFVFMADRWNKDDLPDSRYIWLPIKFDENSRPIIEWKDEWSIQDL